MSVVGSTSILLLFGLGFLISLFAVAVIVVIVAAVVRKSGKSRPAYVPQEPVTPQQEEIRKTLGETLKELRTERNMTQEFVAESLGVSRQAVSKWENGTSEPSTTNLIAIAKLYETAPEELLKKLI
ncbi:MAG: helix-turn-helix transcriptional regulator [Oscillospiraceae bacterium]|nr:helix-turn-helix transcriptional regulator [Oscillospiraceae bacterium]MBQ4547145.1 helix-turn-helix transcriptional regulator [Oscillospiraceae bacterium]MBQ4643841.1 helix-turn-helix transcriptional regulator [Oscillospiraceae bacterium]